MLSEQDFKTIIKLTQLVSIDLIVMNESNILLGKRKNRPAQGYWFVPGGRLYKNETINDGLKRISKSELGFEVNIEDTQLIGVYDHIYEDNFFTDESSEACAKSTHYVVIGLKLYTSPKKISLENFQEQHTHIKWMDVSEILDDDTVHQNTRNYFK